MQGFLNSIYALFYIIAYNPDLSYSYPFVYPILLFGIFIVLSSRRGFLIYIP